MTQFKLGPCPCCGGEAKLHTAHKYGGGFRYDVVYVRCSNCGLSTRRMSFDGRSSEEKDEKILPPERYTKHAAIREVAWMWNRRYSEENSIDV